MRKLLTSYFACILLFACTTNEDEPSLSLGLIADPQYANEEVSGNRFYKESTWKLKEALDTFNFHQVDAVQTLGDVIDKNWSSFDSILPVYDVLNPAIPNYHAVGNHEYSIDSTYHAQILDRLEMPDYYYAYELDNWRFVVLDATDYAYYSKSLHMRSQKEVDDYLALAESGSNDKPWNGAIGKKQQEWLVDQLDIAEELNQSVVLFAHHPVKPKGNSHNIWNDNEIVGILESSKNVFAYVNGHNHAGEYIFENGIHYITIFGMVDTQIASYAILNIYQDSIVLDGYGNQKSINLSKRMD